MIATLGNAPQNSGLNQSFLECPYYYRQIFLLLKGKLPIPTRLLNAKLAVTSQSASQVDGFSYFPHTHSFYACTLRSVMGTGHV